jgi:hypothetical protein
MFTYAALAGFLLLVGVIIWLVIKRALSQAKSIGTMAQVTKDQDLDLKSVIAQRDALAKRSDATKPDEILGGL